MWNSAGREAAGAKQCGRLLCSNLKLPQSSVFYRCYSTASNHLSSFTAFVYVCYMFIKRDFMLFVEMRDVKTLPPVGGQVVGLTLLGDELFVLYHRDDNQVVVYSAETSADYEQLRQFSIHDYHDNYYCDMTSCERHKCLYISDIENIHKLTINGELIAKWPMGGGRIGLSLTPSNNLLTGVCTEIDNESGKVIRQAALQSDINRPMHAVQLADRHYVVAHGVYYDGRVSVVDVNGQVVLSYGDVIEPLHIAVDKDNFIFVADYDNKMTLLSPSLQLVRHIEGAAGRLYFDQKTRRLYASQCEGYEVTIIQT